MSTDYAAQLFEMLCSVAGVFWWSYSELHIFCVFLFLAPWGYRFFVTSIFNFGLDIWLIIILRAWKKYDTVEGCGESNCTEMPMINCKTQHFEMLCSVREWQPSNPSHWCLLYDHQNTPATIKNIPNLHVWDSARNLNMKIFDSVQLIIFQYTYK